MRLNPTIDDLREAFEYDPETGFVKHKPKANPSNIKQLKAWNTKFAGKRAGCSKGPICGPQNERQWYTANSGKYLRLSHIAYALMTGSWPTSEVDHKNLNPSDNRWDNLRAATGSQNSRNRRGWSKIGMPKGVAPCSSSKNFQACIYLPALKRVHLGVFPTPEAAHAAYCTAAKAYFGEFARFE